MGLSLFLLAAYIAFDAAKALVARERPEPTVVGIAITSLSLAVMWWLARAKRRAARGLGSRALEADSFQTTACFWLSLITLVGHRPERRARLVVGGPGGGARHDLVPRERGPRGVARRGVRLFVKDA